jgi:predicted nucleotidyltransferase
VDEVVIYGSRAKGNYREGSDIDITLKGEKLTDNIYSKILIEIDDLNTPYLFDVSIFDKLTSPDLISHINRVGQLFYKK